MRALAKAHTTRTPRDNLIDAMRKHDLDIRGDLARYIDRGDPVWLRGDVLAPCATVTDVSIPVLDTGFDADATAKNGGTVIGVKVGGPAWRAGLRNGMKLVKRLSPYSIDSRKPRVYSVRDNTKMRTITYLPAGPERVRIQTIVPDPLASKRTCLSVLSATNLKGRSSK
jgi:predicted metalloprotease with PDZ domain